MGAAVPETAWVMRGVTLAWHELEPALASVVAAALHRVAEENPLDDLLVPSNSGPSEPYGAC